MMASKQALIRYVTEECTAQSRNYLCAQGHQDCANRPGGWCYDAACERLMHTFRVNLDRYMADEPHDEYYHDPR